MGGQKRRKSDAFRLVSVDEAGVLSLLQVTAIPFLVPI